jgi:predicted nucleotidyltransferase
MRLTDAQRQSILLAARRNFGDDARIWLFGSRVDDARRGGDVDLYIEASNPYPLATALLCKRTLEDSLDLHVDLLVNDRQQSKPIFQIARETGVQL